MRDHEWDLIEVADLLDYMPPATGKNPKPAAQRYQVFRLEEGTGHVLAIRVLKQVDDGTASFTVTDTARITKNSPRWTYVACKAKIAATGGFIVTRADGTQEYEKCPTKRDKAKQGDQA